MAELNSTAACSATSSIGVLDSLVNILVQSLLVAQCNVVGPGTYPRDFASEALANGLENIDFIVIGSGSSGSVMASRLSENPDWNVLLVEAGGDPPQDTEVPALSNVLQFTEQTLDYFTEPNYCSCNAFRNNVCYLPGGRSLGGSNQIDSMAYLTGTCRDYDSWSSAGNYGWSYKDVKPYFEKAITPQGNDTHPKGYLDINKFEQYDDKYSKLLLDAMHELEQPLVEDFTEGSYLGYSFVKGFVDKGRRCSSCKAHLGRVLERPNLKVMKNTQVTKIILDKYSQRVKSVELLVGHKTTIQVMVLKEVIVSLESIETPKLLMLSGIGPRAVLDPLNIMTIRDLPVGQHLKDMVKTEVFIKLNPDAESSRQLETNNNLYNYLSSREGPLRSNGISSLVGFIKSEMQNSPYPDIQIEHKLFQKDDVLFERYLNGLSVKDELKPSLLDSITSNDVLVVSLTLLNPSSQGYLKLRSSSFLDAPIVDPNYLKDQHDVDMLVEGLEYIDKMISTKVLLNANAEMIRPPLRECDLNPYKSKTYWKCYLKYFSSAGNRIVGTAKMGSRHDDTAVVTPRLLVKGVKNLRVVDSSVMPSPPSAASAAPSVMVAEKAADYVKQDYHYIRKSGGKRGKH